MTRWIASTAIVQCRITEQQKADFIRAVSTQKNKYGYGQSTPSEVLRRLILEFTEKHLPEVKE